MKVLFVTLTSLEVNTSVTISNIGVLRGLLDLGYDVEVLMPEIDSSLSYYDNAFNLDACTIKRISNDNNLGATVASISSTSNSKTKDAVLDMMRKIYYKFKLLDRGTMYFKEASNVDVYNDYYDYVISTSDPKSSHIFVEKLIDNGLRYGKWIQHWGDPLASDISQNSIYPNFVVRKKENRIISKADRIIYVSPFTLQVQKKNYRKYSEKMDFVPLACVSEEEEFSLECNKTEEMLRIVYLGDYSSTIRDINPLYEACKENKSIHLTIAGNTDIVLEPQDNIQIFSRVSHERVVELENSADVIVSIGNKRGNQIPGKIYYAASTQKYILATVDGEYRAEMKRYLDSFGRFNCCDNDFDSISEMLNNLLKEIHSSNRKHFTVPEQLRPVNIAKAILGDI